MCCISFKAFCQKKEFDFNLIQNSMDTQKIYISAFWCKPCIEKLKNEINLGNTSNSYFVFDYLLFSNEKLKKIFPEIDSNRVFMIPSKYYRQKTIFQINPSKYALKKFISVLKDNFENDIDPKRIWFGDYIIIYNKFITAHYYSLN